MSAARSAMVAAAGSRCWVKPVLDSSHHAQSHDWCHPCRAPTWLTRLHAEHRRRKYERLQPGQCQCVSPRLVDALVILQFGQGTSTTSGSIPACWHSRRLTAPSVAVRYLSIRCIRVDADLLGIMRQGARISTDDVDVGERGAGSGERGAGSGAGRHESSLARQRLAFEVSAEARLAGGSAVRGAGRAGAGDARAGRPWPGGAGRGPAGGGGAAGGAAVVACGGPGGDGGGDRRGAGGGCWG